MDVKSVRAAAFCVEIVVWAAGDAAGNVSLLARRISGARASCRAVMRTEGRRMPPACK